MTPMHRDLILSHLAAENAHDLDATLATLHPECVFEDIAASRRYDGREGAAAYYRSWWQAFDLQVRGEQQYWTQDGTLIAEAHYVGRHVGAWEGIPPSGRRVDLRLVVVIRFRDGLMAGERFYYDRNSLLAQLGETEAPQRHVPLDAGSSPRFDMYGPIHKGLRAFLAGTLVSLGQLDPADDGELQGGLDQLAQLLEVCSAHLQHEEQFVHAALSRGEGEMVAAEQAHVHHRRAIADLGGQLALLRVAPAAARAPALARLYRTLALFVAESLLHFEQEEDEHNRALWRRHGDAELLALHDSILASIPPEKMPLYLRWIIPSLRHPERLALLTDMQAKLPPPAFAGVLAQLPQWLPERDWRKLREALPVAVPLSA